MHGELVAIDLESTGLDFMNDAVIEVGIVRMKDGVIIDEFSAMVNPDRPIPANVTYITGITQDDVAQAPAIDALLPQISAFIGNVPIIAHNIALDIGFLRDRHGILKSNPLIDTYDLAAVLMPQAARYNLNSLTQEVGIELENAHRALDDARAAALFYWEMWKKALALPRGTLQEIITLADNLEWAARQIFEAALSAQNSSGPTQAQATPFMSLPHVAAAPLSNQGQASPIDVEAAVGMVSTGGALNQSLPQFEERPQQIEMVRAVADAFNQGQQVMIEAGTGTGKSLGYLLPALLWASHNNERVVVSTNTLNLQDQLISQEIPTLRNALNLNFKASVLKGRSNYLCPRRLETLRRRRPTSVEELQTLAKILVWLLESPSGERGEISLRGPIENNVWDRLSAQDENCTLHRCESTMQGKCPFYKARKDAESAHVLIVNHALLISDALTENQVMPEYKHVILDEAHNLEDALTTGMSFHLDQTAIMRRLADLGGPGQGLLGEILSNAHQHAPEKQIIKLEQFIKVIGEVTTTMQIHVRNLFLAFEKFIEEVHKHREGDFFTIVRVNREERAKTSFARLGQICQTLDEFFAVVADAMARLTKLLHKLQEHNIPRLTDLIISADTAASYMQEIGTQLHNFIIAPQENTIYWITQPAGGERPVIHTAPLHIGPLMEKHLWNKKETVILTSATLRSQDNFDYIKDRLFTERMKALEVGSPFNYREATLLFIPNDIPEPNNRQGYQQGVERCVMELAKALDGRMMVLFTSYTQLRQTSQAVSSRLNQYNITVFDQSDGTSRQNLLEGFKSTQKAVLLGTRSFWEGVDIPGDSLSALVITKLPFPVPTDPIHSARSDTYANGFSQFALPDAILRFRQGFGRLIRTRYDRGVVVVLDARIITKSYGVSFLEALPDCTMRDGSLDILGDVAKNWLERG